MLPLSKYEKIPEIDSIDLERNFYFEEQLKNLVRQCRNDGAEDMANKIQKILDM